MEKMYEGQMYDISVNRDWVQEEERSEAVLQNDDNKNRKQVGSDAENKEVSLVNQASLSWF